METGQVQIVALEGVDNSYVSRMVNLTTLAPDIVDAILQNAWEEQRTRVTGIHPETVPSR